MDCKKTCFKCGQRKDRSEFYKHPQMGDGLLGKCKECTKRDGKVHRKEHPEVVRATDKRKYLKRVGGQYLGRYSISMGERSYRRRAHVILGNAVRDGKVSPLPCWVCGSKRTHGHHPDYDRPLDVIWLCPKHHKETHGMVYAETKARALVTF